MDEPFADQEGVANDPSLRQLGAHRDTEACANGTGRVLAHLGYSGLHYGLLQVCFTCERTLGALYA